MLFGSLVGAVTYVHYSGGLFCSSEQVHGANIDHAFGVAFLGGLAGAVLILFARMRRRLLGAVLLLGAAALAVAVALVASDSATYTAQRSCGFMTSTETTFNDRVNYLYVLWGAPLGFLLWAALQGLVPERKPADRASPSPASPRPSARPPTRRRIVQLGVIAPSVVLAAWAAIERGSRPPAKPPTGTNAVHSLEHGAVWITYRPSLPPAEVRGVQLRLRCPRDSRLGAFITRFAGGGQGGEPGGPCTSGTGSPVG
jgi:hypothetical protein